MEGDLPVGVDVPPPKPVAPQVSTTKKGDRLEARARRIVHEIGYTIVARAKRTPIYKMGKVVANNGNIDLAEGAVDFIAIKHGQRTLFVQVTTVKSTSPRRMKLRGIGNFDDKNHEVLLMAWSEDRQAFVLYRKEDNYLQPKDGTAWLIRDGDKRWPWDGPIQQTL